TSPRHRHPIPPLLALDGAILILKRLAMDPLLLLPQPRSAICKDGHFSLRSGLFIHAPPPLFMAAKTIKAAAARDWPIVAAGPSCQITIQLSPDIPKPQAYRLDITPE